MSNQHFSFFCGQGKNVELEKILQFDIFVVKFGKGKNVELYILKGNKYKSTWTMRFSNFIQFSKLVLINAVQIPMPIF